MGLLLCNLEIFCFVYKPKRCCPCTFTGRVSPAIYINFARTVNHALLILFYRSEASPGDFFDTKQKAPCGANLIGKYFLDYK